MTAALKSLSTTSQPENAETMLRGAVYAAMQLDRDNGSAWGRDCKAHHDPPSWSLRFRATPDQVRAVREFVTARLADHAAVDNAVLVASELAANSVAYSSCGPADAFLVHLVEVSATQVAVLLTEWRGPSIPVVHDADAEAESGRGLTVVKSLTSTFGISAVGNVRNILAIVKTDS
jgi:anti-sigma regulatory factor (Ser/Thr protein kinase)